MNFFKSHFKFNKQEQSGIFFLLLMICILQVVYILLNIVPHKKSTEHFSVDYEQQTIVDSLKAHYKENDTIKIFPFNPNFITDFKGYALGMSTAEIDRLLKFRATQSYVNSAKEFQEVTLVSDSLLEAMSVYFKFPEWTQNKGTSFSGKGPLKAKMGIEPERSLPARKDINSASASDLKTIYGIGDKLSERIIKFRNRLGGFLVEEQLQDVYGLEQEVMDRILEKYTILVQPNIKVININTASVQEMAELIYIDTELAIKIIKYRESVGTIHSLDELMSIEGFPTERIARIKLYLQL